MLEPYNLIKKIPFMFIIVKKSLNFSYYFFNFILYKYKKKRLFFFFFVLLPSLLAYIGSFHRLSSKPRTRDIICTCVLPGSFKNAPNLLYTRLVPNGQLMGVRMRVRVKMRVRMKMLAAYPFLP